MPLLEIVTSNKVQATVTLEKSTAQQVDSYAVFAKASADDVVNQALEYVFSKDKDFQKFLESKSSDRPSVPLRIRSNGSSSAKSNGNGNGK